MALLLISLFVTLATSAPVPLQMIDMTYVFDNTTLHWPAFKGFKLTVLENGTQPGGYWLQYEQYFSGVHVGTHIDAPCHAALGQICVDKIPLDRLLAVPAAVVDMTDRAATNRDALLEVRDLVAWETLTGQSLNGKIVLVRTGWGKKWPDKEAFTGTATNDIDKLHYPAISKEAAQWLVDFRAIFGIGVESLSLDNGLSKVIIAHRILLGSGVYGLENVANMDQLPIQGAILYVMPMKIGNGSGAPVRIVATFPKLMCAEKSVTERTLREVITFIQTLYGSVNKLLRDLFGL